MTAEIIPVPIKQPAELIPFEEMEHNPDSENLVKILMERTQNSDPGFFRVIVAYFFSQCAANMRASLETLDRGNLPINQYCIALSVSGAGKGHSMNVMEDDVINQFRYNFEETTLQQMAAVHLPQVANKRAIRHGSDPDDELQALESQYRTAGDYLYTFDHATEAALKQLRQKTLLANGGALNLQIDEIGRNLTAADEAMGPYLELYDVGKIKDSLRKSSTDNKRGAVMTGRTPANLLAFGTPLRLLDGAKTEQLFKQMLDEGYARRSLFAYARNHQRKLDLTPEEILAQRMSGADDAILEAMSDRLGDLANINMAHRKIDVPEEIALLFIKYEQDCVRKAYALPEHEELRRTEMTHRYFKALKLAGAYAFVEMSPEVSKEHAYAAIKLTEESGKAFDKMLKQDQPYTKLAHYLADSGRPMTQHDLVTDLTFYKGSKGDKSEMISLAIAYGYQNNIIVKRSYRDGVEFYEGETLDKTDLNSMIFSYSNELAYNYAVEKTPVKWENLYVLTQAPNVHWANHAFIGGHRAEDKAIAGFNMVVLDVEDSVDLDVAKELLKGYKALFYTTPRHQTTDPDTGKVYGDRFRIILPTNYKLELDGKDFKAFMKNLFDWLPFEVDEATGQRARKWVSHPGNYEYVDGELLDVLPFIPETTRNKQFLDRMVDQQDMDNLERWVINNSGDGNRNNMLLRFAMILVDGGFDFAAIQQRVCTLNDKLPDKLTEAEILGTIMVTVGKALSDK